MMSSLADDGIETRARNNTDVSNDDENIAC